MIGDFFMSKVFGAPEQAKIRQLISEGVTVLQEIEDLNEGLSDTIKAVAKRRLGTSIHRV